MKLVKRAKVVRAMETLCRCINNEDIFMPWLSVGVADGDITEGTTDEDLEYYCENDNFAELMELFLRLMAKAKVDGGLYCDGITSGRR